MKRVSKKGLFALLSLLAIPAMASGSHTQWGYLGKSGPLHWGELSENFKTCSEGKLQTPINIVPTKDIELKALELDYNAGSVSMINNGHTVQVNISEGSTLKIGKELYRLKQFHFHVPSENNIEGDAFPMEIHFVHASDDGKLAVVGVMFEEGEENGVLKKIWSRFPELGTGKEIPCKLSAKEIKALMPDDKEYYSFTGSLTTPPCTEGVKWHIFKKPMSISKEQVNTFFSLFGFPNNRPIQPANGREILE